MSSDDYQVKNIYRYARKSYKNCRGEAHDNCTFSCQDEGNVESESPRSDRAAASAVPRCSCPERENDLACILHKKCPVITLAKQQLQRILDDTDRLLCDNNRSCRSFYDFLCLCRDICKSHNKCTCALIIIMGLAFFMGIFFGAASCGSYLGRFNSPIMTCLENRFMSERSINMDEYRGIV